MIYRLIALNGSLRGERLSVPATPLKIGRAEGSDLRISDPEMALQHAIVSLREERLHITDCGSMNRILVNNREVRESFLKHGDVIELGQTRFLVQAYVQADVKDADARRSRRAWRWILALLSVVGATAAGWHLWSKRPPKDPPPIVIDEAILADLDPEPVMDVTNGLPISDVVDSTAETTGTEPVVVTPPAELSDTNWLESELGAPTNPPPVVSNDTPAPPPVEPPPGVIEPAPPAVDPLTEKVKSMFDEAKAKQASGNIMEADEIFSSIQRVMPEFVPAYVERARRLQQLGMLDLAIHEWGEVVRLAKGTAEAEEARAAIVTLERARHEPTAPFNSWISLVSANISKFPETGDSREMRLLTMVLATGKASSQIDPSAVNVVVKFYDQEDGSGFVRPTRAKAPDGPISASGLWHVGETKTVTASYVIPMSEPEKRDYRYYGYEIKIYYQGAVQAVVREPSDLHQRLRSGARNERSTGNGRGGA